MTEKRHVSRRTFLGAAGGLAAASIAGSHIGTAVAAPEAPSGTGWRTVPPGRLGIQQWSIRDAITANPDTTSDSPTGFLQVFQALSGLGYRGFEFFGNYTQHVNHLGRQPTIAEIRQYLDDASMAAVGSHRSYDQMSTSAGREEQFEIALELGMELIGTANNALSGIPGSGNPPDRWEQAAERDNEIGAHAAEFGLTWYQHPHQNEYQFLDDGSGRRGYEYWLELTDPDLVNPQMDVYWAHVARLQFQTYLDADGVEQTSILDPQALAVSLGKRASSFHIKDGVSTGPTSLTFANVGEGILPLQEFCSAQPARGSKWYLAERDSVSSGEGSAAARRMADAAVHAANMLSWRG